MKGKYEEALKVNFKGIYNGNRSNSIKYIKQFLGWLESLFICSSNTIIERANKLTCTSLVKKQQNAAFSGIEKKLSFI